MGVYLEAFAAIAGAVSAVAGAASAIAAFRAIRSESTARANERVLQHLVVTLERAYSALAGPDRQIRGDRLAWLTAARLLEEYKTTKSRLEDKALRAELESHEEHWRRQMYLLVEPVALDFQFFTRSEIEKTSGTIILNFVEWPEGKEDPIARYGGYRGAVEVLPVSIKWAAFRHYLDPS